jgi:hypothetical protein
MKIFTKKDRIGSLPKTTVEDTRPGSEPKSPDPTDYGPVPPLRGSDLFLLKKQVEQTNKYPPSFRILLTVTYISMYLY